MSYFFKENIFYTEWLIYRSYFGLIISTFIVKFDIIINYSLIPRIHFWRRKNVNEEFVLSPIFFKNTKISILYNSVLNNFVLVITRGY
jgi:uncharacterized membrane protein